MNVTEIKSETTHLCVGLLKKINIIFYLLLSVGKCSTHTVDTFHRKDWASLL